MEEQEGGRVTGKEKQGPLRMSQAHWLSCSSYQCPVGDGNHPHIRPKSEKQGPEQEKRPARAQATKV